MVKRKKKNDGTDGDKREKGPLFNLLLYTFTIQKKKKKPKKNNNDLSAVDRVDAELHTKVTLQFHLFVTVQFLKSVLTL